MESLDWMIEELVSRVFAARHAAHLEHWKTNSFSKHMALGDFYDQIIDTIDKFVECYQGLYGHIGDVKSTTFPLDALKWMPKELKWLEENWEKIANKDTMLDNILQDLRAIYAQTFFKLECLH